jgi:ABC-type transporter Mla MlaB component
VTDIGDFVDASKSGRPPSGRLHFEMDDCVMTLSSEATGPEAPLLQVELVDSPRGYLARFSGDLVAETTGVLWGIEPILLNETRISVDLSGVTSVDQAGLKATLKLIEALHAFGGKLTLGG